MRALDGVERRTQAAELQAKALDRIATVVELCAKPLKWEMRQRPDVSAATVPPVPPRPEPMVMVSQP